MEYLQVAIQAVISIAVLFLLAKWMGCRQISEMSIFDYINGITIGSIAADVAMAEKEMVPSYLVAMLTFAAITVGLSWATDKSAICRRLIVGKPYILFQNGEFYYKNMKKTKIDIGEFMMACRMSGYFDLSKVQAAVLEANGQISFLAKGQNRPYTPADAGLEVESARVCANVIMEGHVMKGNLRNAGKDEKWLNAKMKQHGISSANEVFLAVQSGEDDCYFFKKKMENNDRDVLE